MSTHVTTLDYQDAQGETLARAFHRDAAVNQVQESTWSAEPSGRFGFQMDGGGLPRSLMAPLPLHAEDLSDAIEALTRIGQALEAYDQDMTDAKTRLAQRVAAAQAYGKTPELPLDES